MPREIEHRGRATIRPSEPESRGAAHPESESQGGGASAADLGAKLLREGDLARAEVLLRQASADGRERVGAVRLLWQLHEQRGSMPVDEARVASLLSVVGRGFARYESAHAVMLSDAPAHVASARMGTLERTRTEFIKWARRSGLHPGPEASKHLCVLFAGREAYVAFAREQDGLDASSIGGHYSSSKERIAMYADDRGAAGSDGLVVRATHEAAHMVAFRTGVQTRRRTQPFWLSEGLASAFEPIGETIGTPDRARERLREAYLAIPESTGVSIESLVFRDAPSGEDAERIAAMYRASEALVRYLARHRSADLAAYMESLATGAPGRRTGAELRAEFVAHFGEPAKVEREMRLRPW